MTRILRTLAILFVLGPMAACTAVTPAGLVAASRLDPLGTAPADIAFALSVPDSIKLQTGDALLRIAFTPSGQETPSIAQTMPLDLASDDAGAIPSRHAGEVVYIARIAPAHAPRFADAQAAIRAARASGVQGNGTLTVDLVGGCALGPLPDALPARVWLRTDPEGDFVPLTRRVDLFAAMGPQADALRDRLHPC